MNYRFCIRRHTTDDSLDNPNHRPSNTQAFLVHSTGNSVSMYNNRHQQLETRSRIPVAPEDIPMSRRNSILAIPPSNNHNSVSRYSRTNPAVVDSLCSNPRTVPMSSDSSRPVNQFLCIHDSQNKNQMVSR